MKKIIQPEQYTVVCDTCGENLTMYDITLSSPPIELNYKDGTRYDFCNLKCLTEFIRNEIKKRNPETRFLYGKGK